MEREGEWIYWQKFTCCGAGKSKTVLIKYKSCQVWLWASGKFEIAWPHLQNEDSSLFQPTLQGLGIIYKAYSGQSNKHIPFLPTAQFHFKIGKKFKN